MRNVRDPTCSIRIGCSYSCRHRSMPSLSSRTWSRARSSRRSICFLASRDRTRSECKGDRLRHTWSLKAHSRTLAHPKVNSPGWVRAQGQMYDRRMTSDLVYVPIGHDRFAAQVITEACRAAGIRAELVTGDASGVDPVLGIIPGSSPARGRRRRGTGPGGTEEHPGQHEEATPPTSVTFPGASNPGKVSARGGPGVRRAKGYPDGGGLGLDLDRDLPGDENASRLESHVPVEAPLLTQDLTLCGEGGLGVAPGVVDHSDELQVESDRPGDPP